MILEYTRGYDWRPDWHQDTELNGISIFETSCYAVLVTDGQWRS